MKKNSNEHTDKRIISFSKYQGQMTWAALKQMEAYWEGLRHGRTVPLRTDVNPRGIENVLEYAFILERIAPGLARFRLAGMHLVDLIGMEVRGMPLTSFFVPNSRKPVSSLLEDVFQGPETATLTLKGEAGFGKPDLEARMLLLPLKSDLGDVSRILGCLVTDGSVGRTPRRFEIISAERSLVQPKSSILTAPPAPEKSQPVAEPSSKQPTKQAERGFAETATPFQNKPKVPYLRLVETPD